MGEPPRRIGLLGGSFDPVHAGHLHVACAAQRAFGLDRVVFVPAARPPHKSGRRLAAARHRVAMLELALRGRPDWTISSIELERAGPSYTADTVRALRAAIREPEGAQIFLILGSDNLRGLPEWREAEWLVGHVQPIVVPRAEDPLEPAMEDVERRFPPSLSAKLRRGLLPVPACPGSSSGARAALAAGAAAPDLPPGVREYIERHGLYRDRDEAERR